MEWKAYHVEKPIDRKTEIIKWRSLKSKRDKIIECCVFSTVYYMAVKVTKNGKKQVQAEIFVTSVGKDYDNFSFQHYIETENPMYRRCPKKILDLLTETDDEKALLWREKCRKEHENKKQIRNEINSLQNLPMHSLIEVKLDEQKTMILEKSFFCELKRPVWVNWKKWMRYETDDIYKMGYSVIRRGEIYENK